MSVPYANIFSIAYGTFYERKKILSKHEGKYTFSIPDSNFY